MSLARRLPGQGRVARPRRAVPGRGRPHALLRRRAGPQPPRRRGARARRGAARRQGRDPQLQQRDRVRVRVRDRAPRRRLVPDQPAQRDGREPGAARALRLRVPDLPPELRADGRASWGSRRPSASTTWRRGSAEPGGAADPVDDLAMLVGTGGTTGLPKGVMLTSRNLETMTAMTLVGYPFEGRPGVPRARAADPRRRRAVLPGDGARRADRRDAQAGRGRVPRADRARAHHAHVPAADADLHAARPRGAATPPTSARCSASGTARRRCRPPGWRRR